MSSENEVASPKDFLTMNLFGVLPELNTSKESGFSKFHGDPDFPRGVDWELDIASPALRAKGFQVVKWCDYYIEGLNSFVRSVHAIYKGYSYRFYYA